MVAKNVRKARTERLLALAGAIVLVLLVVILDVSIEVPTALAAATVVWEYLALVGSKPMP